MMKKKDKEDTHKMGKYTGYEKFPDGSIKIARVYVKEFHDLGDERTALNQMMEMAINRIKKLLEKNAERTRKLWAKITEDFGLSAEEHFIYHGRDELIRPLKEKEKTK